MQTLVSKIEFAKLKNRNKSAVSRWIAEGKISRAAIIGEGLRARIWVERADADLAQALDPGQQFAQEQPILGASAPPLAAGEEEPPAADRSAGRAPPTPRSDADAEDDHILRRRKADADRAESEAELARRRLALDEGRWIDADKATKAWSAQMASQIAETETFLGNTLARELADKYGLDWRALSVDIRAAYRSFRTTVADRAAAERADREAALMEAAE